MSEETLYARKQIAEKINCHPLSIRKWEREGLIKPVYLPGNKKPRYRLSDFLNNKPLETTQ
jgi:DNA-binding transcriptional MerR regulator